MNENRILVLTLLVLAFSQAIHSAAFDLASESHHVLRSNETIPEKYMPSIGNGFLATVVGSNATFIAGIFNGKSTIDPSHRARVPATSSVSISSSSVVPVSTALDLDKALFTNDSRIVNSSSGEQIGFIQQRWYAHQLYSGLLITEIETFNLSSALEVVLQLNHGNSSNDIVFQSFSCSISGAFCIAGRTATAELPGGPQPTVALVSTGIPQAPFTLLEGSHIYRFITAISTSLQESVPTEAVVELYQWAVALPDGSLLDSHIAGWTALRQHTGIEVEGDDTLDLAVQSSFYFLLSSMRLDMPWSLATGGLALGADQSCYNGHVFSDAETWMTPGLMLFYPDHSAAVLQYRYNHMAGAAAKALSYGQGYQGTMYPWESAFSGQEVCPSFAPTGTYEQHISGDIARAVKRHWEHTLDTNWLWYMCAPMMAGIAEFWASRVSFNESISQYEIRGVIPMDERMINVNNSVFTNVMAAMALDFANEVTVLLGGSANSTYATIAQNLRIAFDEQNQRHLPFDDYYAVNRSVGGAEVVMLGYPIQVPGITADVRMNDYTFYNPFEYAWYWEAPRSMIFSMYSIAAVELQDLDNAQHYFDLSYIDMKAPFNVFFELMENASSGGCHNFITGYGAFLQALTYGWGQLRINESMLYMNPMLPPASTATQIKWKKVFYQGITCDIEYNSTATSITLTTPDQTALLLLGGSTLTLNYNITTTFSAAPFALSTANSKNKKHPTF